MTKAQPLCLKHTINANTRPKFSEEILVSENLTRGLYNWEFYTEISPLSYGNGYFLHTRFQDRKTCYATEKRENASEMCNHPI